jgi:hypothetical protein
MLIGDAGLPAAAEIRREMRVYRRPLSLIDIAMIGEFLVGGIEPERRRSALEESDFLSQCECATRLVVLVYVGLVRGTFLMW